MSEGRAALEASDHRQPIQRCNTAPADGAGSMAPMGSTFDASTHGSDGGDGGGTVEASGRKAPPKRSSSLMVGGMLYRPKALDAPVAQGEVIVFSLHF